MVIDGNVYVPGRPRPRVTWFLENEVIDQSYDTRTDGMVVNHLTFKNVQKEHLHKRLICQATNNNLVEPEMRAAVLDINCKYNFVFLLLCSFSLFVICFIL